MAGEDAASERTDSENLAERDEKEDPEREETMKAGGLQMQDIQISYDWDELLSMNRDAVGWLYMPESMIDFPVVGAGDNSFYLKHDFSGEESRSGCLFMDKDTEMADFNRVIYGHNMGAGSEAMFSTLLRFEDESYFEGNRYFYFTGVHGETEAYEVIAAVKFDVEDIGEWDFRMRNYDSAESRGRFMEQVEERALHYREGKELPEKLMILSTCDRREHGKDGRFLVVGAAY